MTKRIYKFEVEFELGTKKLSAERKGFLSVLKDAIKNTNFFCVSEYNADYMTPKKLKIKRIK